MGLLLPAASGAIKVAKFPKLMERLTDIAGPLAGPKTRQAIEDFTHITLVVLNQTCFASGTPILTPDGVRPIESLAAGDQVWARSELNPRAPVVARTIERVFEFTGPILELHAGGRIVKTTAEHPFYVADQGWCRARDLIPGLPLAGLDERTTELERIVVTEQTATVYNIRVAEDHTYFVGAEDWGFSLWVHNAYSWVKNAEGKYDILDNATTVVKSVNTQAEADDFIKTINEATNAIGDAAKKEVPKGIPKPGVPESIGPVAPNSADDLLVRRGTSRESAQRLAKQAEAAEKAGTAQNGVPYGHGVSVTTPESNLRLAKDPHDAVAAQRKALEEAGFEVRPTPTRADPNHHTVQLPKPVTEQVADLFNQIFGRKPKGGN